MYMYVILNLAQYYTSHIRNVYVHVCTGSGTCVGFNPFLDHLFLVGSESGHIYKCSKAYTKHFLDVTKVHSTMYTCVLHVHVCTTATIQLALVSPEMHSFQRFGTKAGIEHYVCNSAGVPEALKHWSRKKNGH